MKTETLEEFLKRGGEIKKPKAELERVQSFFTTYKARKAAFEKATEKKKILYKFKEAK